VPVFDHGFVYGEGVYETMRTYNRVPFLFDRHMRRLRQSSERIALGVPFDDDATFESFSKNGAIVFKKPTQEGIHIEDVKQLNGQWLIAGTSGVVLIVVGTGSTMKQAQAQVYSRIKNILIPNMYYRTDIGDRWVEDSDKLHNWGYLR